MGTLGRRWHFGGLINRFVIQAELYKTGKTAHKCLVWCYNLTLCGKASRYVFKTENWEILKSKKPVSGVEKWE